MRPYPSTCLRLLPALLGLVLLLPAAMPSAAERLKDISSISGIRNNQLIGYGIAVGLDGTGDQTTQTPFTRQSVVSMLQALGVSVPAGQNIQLKNTAAVIVTATLPPFSRPGQSIDVTVSSLGNAKSLRGGLRHGAGQRPDRRRRRWCGWRGGAGQPVVGRSHSGWRLC